ncbi:hypothetical protein [Agrococcus sp. BE272]|uniref:hypothetical protein n=1 Tax=Agrococcus sp. BE272 TaxID=2817727 RepID=UPI002861083B|nr:hypothetical protein [Agrococcus sp. BE272]MDR7234822.1 hypothetical protein [Agrococcus sp. BE272]
MAAAGERDAGADTSWLGVMRLGGAAAIVVLAMIPIQAAVFLLHPPPSTVEGLFEEFQQQPLLGLLDLDLLLTLDYLVMIPFYLALYASLRRVAQAWGLLALVVGLISVTLFVVTREATFSMWMLSERFADAPASEQAALLASGETLMTLYDGGTFATSYVLGAVSTLVFSATMWRQRVFGRAPGIVGVVTGMTMLVPANVGAVGLVIAMLSLIPTAVWLVLLARSLLRARRAAATSEHARFT